MITDFVNYLDPSDDIDRFDDDDNLFEQSEEQTNLNNLRKHVANLNSHSPNKIAILTPDIPSAQAQTCDVLYEPIQINAQTVNQIQKETAYNSNDKAGKIENSYIHSYQ